MSAMTFRRNPTSLTCFVTGKPQHCPAFHPYWAFLATGSGVKTLAIRGPVGVGHQVPVHVGVRVHVGRDLFELRVLGGAMQVEDQRQRLSRARRRWDVEPIVTPHAVEREREDVRPALRRQDGVGRHRGRRRGSGAARQCPEQDHGGHEHARQQAPTHPGPCSTIQQAAGTDVHAQASHRRRVRAFLDQTTGPGPRPDPSGPRQPRQATFQRRMFRRSASVVPPHSPVSEQSASANSRQSRRTGHVSHKRPRRGVAGVRPPDEVVRSLSAAGRPFLPVREHRSSRRSLASISMLTAPVRPK